MVARRQAVCAVPDVPDMDKGVHSTGSQQMRVNERPAQVTAVGQRAIHQQLQHYMGFNNALSLHYGTS